MTVRLRHVFELIAVLATAGSCASTAMAGPVEDCNRLRGAAALAPCTLVVEDKAQTPRARAIALLMRARAALDMSELDKADADIKAAFALQPMAFGHRVRGRLHALRGQNAEARDDYTQAISLSDSKLGRYVSYTDRGNFLLHIMDLPGALNDFDLAIHLDPTKAAAYVGRALTNKAAGKIGEALADLNQAKAVEPGYWLTYVEQGDILLAEKRFAEAIAAYDAALKLRPNDARAGKGRAAATALAGSTPAPAPAPSPTVAQPAPAPSLPTAAPAQQAEERRNKLKEALELRQKGKNLEALALYEALLKQVPADAEVAVLKGRTLIALARWKDALDALKTVTDNKTAPPPLKALAFESQGEVFARNNMFAPAIASTTAALQINPKLEGALFWRGVAVFSIGAFDKALADFQQAASLQPKSALFPGWQAIALVSAGDLQKAREAIDRTFALQADNPFALTARARLRLATGEIDAAEADLSQLVRQGPLNSVALQTQQLIMVHKVMKPSDRPLTKAQD